MPFPFDAHKLAAALAAHGFALDAAQAHDPNIVHGRRRDGAEIWIDAGGRLRYQARRPTQAAQTRHVTQDGLDYRVLAEPYTLVTITATLTAGVQLADALAALDALAHEVGAIPCGRPG